MFTSPSFFVSSRRATPFWSVGIASGFFCSSPIHTFTHVFAIGCPLRPSISLMSMLCAYKKPLTELMTKNTSKRTNVRKDNLRLTKDMVCSLRDHLCPAADGLTIQQGCKGRPSQDVP